MNKQVLIAIVVIVVIALAGFLFLKAKKNPTVSPSTNQTKTGGNIFSSIQDALSKSISLQCNFTDETGRKTTSYIKNGAVRADITAQNTQESGSVIVKDKKMYFWNKSQAFMMDLSSVEVTPGAGSSSSNQGQTQEQNLMSSLEKYKQYCKPAVVSDSLFTPPADVKFQDLSQIMKTQTGGNGTIPTINQSQYQKYLQQISQPPQQ